MNHPDFLPDGSIIARVNRIYEHYVGADRAAGNLAMTRSELAEKQAQLTQLRAIESQERQLLCITLDAIGFPLYEAMRCLSDSATSYTPENLTGLLRLAVKAVEQHNAHVAAIAQLADEIGGK